MTFRPKCSSGSRKPTACFPIRSNAAATTDVEPHRAPIDHRSTVIPIQILLGIPKTPRKPSLQSPRKKRKKGDSLTSSSRSTLPALAARVAALRPTESVPFATGRAEFPIVTGQPSHYLPDSETVPSSGRRGNSPTTPLISHCASEYVPIYEALGTRAGSMPSSACPCKIGMYFA